MLKGGYKIINLKNIDLISATGEIIDGIYEEIESNYNKVILVTGIVKDDIEKADAFVQVTTNGTDFEFIIYGTKVVISDDDSIYTEEASGCMIYKHTVSLIHTATPHNLYLTFYSSNGNLIQSVDDLKNNRTKYVGCLCEDSTLNLYVVHDVNSSNMEIANARLKSTTYTLNWTGFTVDEDIVIAI